jgi:DNA-binding XRE family transcriptional regulator
LELISFSLYTGGVSDPEMASSDGVQAESAFPGFRDMGPARARLVADLVASRRTLGLTQAEVARRMGTSQSAIARLEAQGADARLSTLDRYAAALGRQLQWRLAPPTAKGDS